MPLFWSVNKLIRTDTVFHIIICEKHGTSTRATAPWAAKIWPRRAIFGPVPVTRYPRAPRRFCRSGVRGSRSGVRGSRFGSAWSGVKIASAAGRFFPPVVRPGRCPEMPTGWARRCARGACWSIRLGWVAGGGARHVSLEIRRKKNGGAKAPACRKCRPAIRRQFSGQSILTP